MNPVHRRAHRTPPRRLNPAAGPNGLEVFYGQATPGECRLYVRLAGLDASDGWRLTGRVRGPECRYAQTLPADYPLRSHEPGSALLAEAFIPDPCFWSPALPQLYEATIELVHNGTACGSATRMVGVRPLGARGRSLYWEGKRWVLRGIVANEVANPSVAGLNAWHDGPTAMLVDHPSDELCERASLDGVLIVARITGSQARLSSELRRGWRVGPASAWPSCIRPRRICRSCVTARNIVIAQFLPKGNGQNAVTPAAGAQVVVWELGRQESITESPLELATALRNCPLPLIAYCAASPQSHVVTGRATCDLLQSELAPIGDFAGYIV